MHLLNFRTVDQSLSQPKPWMKKEVQSLLKVQNSAFRSGDKAQYSVVRANLGGALRLLRKKEIEDNLQNNLWQV